MPRFRRILAILVLLKMCIVQVALAEEVSYLKQIKPILEAKCYPCHGAIKQEGQLRLETKSLMLEGGDSGAVIVAGDAEKSLILERITDDDLSRMPPEGEGARLKKDEIELIRRWITEGASAPDEEIPISPKDHWAFRTLQAPNHGDITIDSYLIRRLNEEGLQPQTQAERSLLIRRIYLDLIGLPPTLEQLHDERPWEEIVDDLLDSPHYGERWGRHWMDIWRYSDWYGLGAQLRYSQKHLWHWRDWIVNSLNADKGYDRMILEMLAGDELDPDNPEVIAGTGFLARNYYLFNRTTWLDSTIEHTGKAFLGLTLNCGKCHDHKYDPFSQVDYYNLRAIFEPHQVRLDPIPGVTSFEQDGLPRVFDDQPEAVTYFHIKGDPKNPDKEIEIRPQVPELFASFQPEVQPIELPATAYVPGIREYVKQDQLKLAESAIAMAKEELATAHEKYETWKKTEPQKPAGDSEAPNEVFEFVDEFDAPNQDAWEITGDAWEYADGTLRRSTSTRDRELVTLKTELPRDFEVRCRYTTTGGDLYKSVTFRFDQSGDGRYDNFVYTSAHAPAPKIQAAYTRNGTTSYPPQGRVAKAINVGELIDLRFAVRDRLVNVWWGDEFVLAYSLPDRKPEGRFSLSGFDATVAFDSISIRSLPSDFKMTDAKNAAAPSDTAPEHAFKLAEAKLKMVTAKLDSLKAIFAADQAVYLDGERNSDPKTIEAKKQTAAIEQAQWEVATAQYEKLTAGADQEKQDVAQKKIDAAQEKLKRAEAGNGTYSSVRASFKALETPAHKEPDYPPVYAPVSTGRRLALARWMTSRENPLTARVAVNHIWLRHFGTPLVESVFDFGLRAPVPEHQELLDYLAWELMESGWSMKHVHRLIVTSQAYRRSTSSKDADTGTLAKDSTNRFYWRMNFRRMEAQVIRDSLLKLAGTLDTTMGGPSVDVGYKSTRRSIYFKHSRDQQDKFLSMFDDADLLQCYRRNESIVPQQALALANSELSLKLSGQIAERLSEKDLNQFLAKVFETLLGRQPTNEEMATCHKYCDQIESVLTSDGTAQADLSAKVRERLVHSLLNHNDFISIR